MKYLNLFSQSIALDKRFFAVSKWPRRQKVKFLYAKYLSIFRHLHREFILGKDKINFDNRELFYDSQYGLAGYQSMLTRHQYMLQVAGITSSKIKTIVDCGANVGFFSLMVNDVYPEANIYAIEPVPQTLECLRNNTRNITKIACFGTAISDESGTAKMSFNQDDSVTSSISSEGSIEVPMKTLDEFCRNESIGEIDILKIDTESFEAHVLRGAEHILSKTKYLFIEVTLRNHSNYTISSLMSLLYSEDFDFQLVAFRNYSNRGEGKVEIMDCLMRNEKLANIK